MAVSSKDIIRQFQGLESPISSEELLKHAEERGMDKQVREALRKLPQQTFQKPADLLAAINKIEQRNA